MATGKKGNRKYSARSSQRNPKSASPTPKKGAPKTVEDILGKPGEPIDAMTAVANTNPNYSTGDWEWTHNCQRCIWAFEAQRRGYDVEAKPRTSDDEYSMAHASLPKSYLNVAVDPITKEPVKLSAPHGNIFGGPPKVSEIKDDILSNNPEGARGFFRISRVTSGHVFNWEISNGKLQIYEAQTGEKRSLSQYIKNGAITFQWARTDNLEFTPLIEDFVQRRQK